MTDKPIITESFADVLRRVAEKRSGPADVSSKPPPVFTPPMKLLRRSGLMRRGLVETNASILRLLGAVYLAKSG